MSYYVALKTGEEMVSGRFEYPTHEKEKRDTWQVEGPLEKKAALKSLQKLVTQYGKQNVHLLCKVPWSVETAVSSDCEVKFVYGEEKCET